MSAFKQSVTINNEVTDPIGDYVIDYLLAQTKETSFHDFKWTIDASKNSTDFSKIIKDVYAFSNYGGGWLVLGVKENDHSDEKIKGKFVKVGLPDDFVLEDAALQQKINSFLAEPIAIHYTEFPYTINKKERRFALIYFPPSPQMMIPKSDITYNDASGKKKTAVSKGQVYTRRGTQSIPASSYEKKLIEKRLEKNEYRLSILSGEPDEIHEIIYSNLFEVKQIPDKVYLGTAKHKSFSEIVRALQLLHPREKYFPLKFSKYKNKIVTFANLADWMDIHSQIVYPNEITQESVLDWLKDADKESIIVSLLNYEVTDKAKQQGMRYDRHAKKLYYVMSPDQQERKEEWPTRYRGKRKKQVAKKIRVDELNRDVYLHSAVKARITKIGDKFYLMLNPTVMLTKDGKTPITGIKENAIVTGQTYRIYNKQQLNNILFWINKLGNGDNVLVINNFEISNIPVQTSMEIGISWDIPTTDFKQIIEEFDAAAEQAESESYGKETGEESYDF